MDRPFGLRPRAALLAAALIGLTLMLTLASRADALIYWSNGGPGTIGRADLDATHVDHTFITGATDARGLAVDTTHLYWAGFRPLGNGTVGRANIDGSGADKNFITGDINPFSLAIDSSHVYWNEIGGDRIGRAELGGGGVDPDFITGFGHDQALATDGAHIYWSNDNAIGRANVDGSGVDQDFIIAAAQVGGLAVDGSHVYWSNTGANAIGRANLDGTDVDHAFVANISGPLGLAVDASHIYWVSNNAIGRANLDGTAPVHDLITGTGQTFYVALDAKRYPDPDAGADRTVSTGAPVTLDGTDTTDANGGTLAYAWSQIGGSTVDLSGAATATPSFKAPDTAETLEFRLEVCDADGLCEADTTKVSVDPTPRITQLKMSPKAFAASTRKTPLRGKTGALIKLTLSEDARVRFRVRRDPPRKGADGPPAEPRVFRRSLAEGRSSVEFTGTLGTRTLEPGAYRLIARARDSVGGASTRVRTSFEITRR